MLLSFWPWSILTLIFLFFFLSFFAPYIRVNSEKFSLKQLRQWFLASCTLRQSITGYCHLSEKIVFHTTVTLKQVLSYSSLVWSIQKYAFKFFYLFLLNLIGTLFSLFIGIILNTNLLTELVIDKLGIYHKMF